VPRASAGTITALGAAGHRRDVFGSRSRPTQSVALSRWVRVRPRRHHDRAASESTGRL